MPDEDTVVGGRFARSFPISGMPERYTKLESRDKVKRRYQVGEGDATEGKWRGGRPIHLNAKSKVHG